MKETKEDQSTFPDNSAPDGAHRRIKLLVIVIVVVLIVAMGYLSTVLSRRTSPAQHDSVAVVSPSLVESLAGQNLTLVSVEISSEPGIPSNSISAGASILLRTQTNGSAVINITSLKFYNESTASFYCNELYQNETNTKRTLNISSDFINSSFDAFNYTYLLRNQSNGYFLEAFGRSNYLVFIIEDVGIPLTSAQSLIDLEAGALESHH